MKNLNLDSHITLAKNNFPKLLRLTGILSVIIILINIRKFFIQPPFNAMIVIENLSEACLMLILMFFLAYGSGLQKLRNMNVVLADLFFFLFAIFFSRSFIRGMEAFSEMIWPQGTRETSSLTTFLLFAVLCVGLRTIFYFFGEISANKNRHLDTSD